MKLLMDLKVSKWTVQVHVHSLCINDSFSQTQNKMWSEMDTLRFAFNWNRKKKYSYINHRLTCNLSKFLTLFFVKQIRLNEKWCSTKSSPFIKLRMTYSSKSFSIFYKMIYEVFEAETIIFCIIDINGSFKSPHTFKQIHSKNLCYQTHFLARALQLLKTNFRDRKKIM